MRVFTLFFLLCFRLSLSFGQLLPGIGLTSLPADNDAVCVPPVYSGSYTASGYFEGDTVPDFTLYDNSGNSFTLSAMLQSGLPVLLVAGSYTCPVFRGKIPDINNMAALYSGLLNILVVYTIEAHPFNDPSPYSGTVWVPSANYADNVLFMQPVTYGERKSLIDSMLVNYPINVPVVVDGPCNEWWSNYGPAPNNAYLINTVGVVVEKQAWFDKAPDNMYCAIDSLLGMQSGYCTSFGNNGDFSFVLAADSADYGTPGTTLEVHGTLTNNSTTDNAVIDIIKRIINVPAGWQTALCADVCYAPSADSIRITLPPSGVQPFTFYFYTDLLPSQGDVRVLFRNANLPGNRVRQGFYGYTNTTGLAQSETEHITVFPVPFQDKINIMNLNHQTAQFIVYDAFGRLIVSGSTTGEINLSELSSGIYLLDLIQGEKRTAFKLSKM